MARFKSSEEILKWKDEDKICLAMDNLCPSLVKTGKLPLASGANETGAGGNGTMPSPAILVIKIEATQSEEGQYKDKLLYLFCIFFVPSFQSRPVAKVIT